MDKPKGSKRGFGACGKCSKEFPSHKKTRHCKKCGNFLEGKFEEKPPYYVEPNLVAILGKNK